MQLDPYTLTTLAIKFLARLARSNRYFGIMIRLGGSGVVLLLISLVLALLAVVPAQDLIGAKILDWGSGISANLGCEIIAFAVLGFGLRLFVGVSEDSIDKQLDPDEVRKATVDFYIDVLRSVGIDIERD